jgi:hypothetical protein
VSALVLLRRRLHALQVAYCLPWTQVLFDISSAASAYCLLHGICAARVLAQAQARAVAVVLHAGTRLVCTHSILGTSVAVLPSPALPFVCLLMSVGGIQQEEMKGPAVNAPSESRPFDEC